MLTLGATAYANPAETDRPADFRSLQASTTRKLMLASAFLR